MTDKIKGQIKWYNSDRGFGVITGSDGREYFLHQSHLPEDIGEIIIGIRLIFNTQPRPRHKGGEEAYDIKLDTSPISIRRPAKTIGHIQTSPKVTQTQSSVTDYWYESYSAGIDHHAPNKEASMEAKVVGVTYEGRQEIVNLLSVGEEVLLMREPDNPYDGNAIRVVRKNGQCFGFLNRDLAFNLASKLDRYGQPVEATVKSVTGGYDSRSSLGVVIQFTIPNVSTDNPIFDV